MKISGSASAAPVSRTTDAAPAAKSAPAAPVAQGWVAKTSAPKAVAAAPAASPGDVVSAFYKAFETKDVDTQEKLYAPNVKFKDAIFSFDNAKDTANMFRKLNGVDPNAKIKFTLDSVNGSTVKGHWVADYHVLGRPVHNEVSTTMKVENGKITEHTDDFSWKKWAPQAFPAGALFTLPGLDFLAKAAVRTFLG